MVIEQKAFSLSSGSSINLMRISVMSNFRPSLTRFRPCHRLRPSRFLFKSEAYGSRVVGFGVLGEYQFITTGLTWQCLTLVGSILCETYRLGSLNVLWNFDAMSDLNDKP
jgi:hypothetical protein